MNESAQHLIADLEIHGVRLLIDGSQLILDAPRGVLTAQEVEHIRAVKPELLAALKACHDRNGDHIPRPADPAAEAATLLNQLRCYTTCWPDARREAAGRGTGTLRTCHRSVGDSGRAPQFRA
jgi:hypothetical protein